MNLLKKIAVTGTLGLATVVGGCEATTQAERDAQSEAMIGLLLMGTGIRKNNPSAAAVGRGILDHAIAKTGRDQPDSNQYPVTASFDNIDVEHNCLHSGEKGIKILVDFTVQGLYGNKAFVSAHFYDSSGRPLKDRDGKFRTDDGYVAVGGEKTLLDFRPGTKVRGYAMFIPLDQLDIPRIPGTRRNLSMDLCIWGESPEKYFLLAKSGPKKFFMGYD